MALPTYNVEYVESVKTLELWEDGGFKYSKNRQRDGKIYFRCNKVIKYALYNHYICSTYNIKFSLLYIHVGSWAISGSVSVHTYMYLY